MWNRLRFLVPVFKKYSAFTRGHFPHLGSQFPPIGMSAINPFQHLAKSHQMYAQWALRADPQHPDCHRNPSVTVNNGGHILGSEGLKLLGMNLSMCQPRIWPSCSECIQEQYEMPKLVGHGQTFNYTKEWVPSRVRGPIFLPLLPSPVCCTNPLSDSYPNCQSCGQILKQLLGQKRGG